MAGQRLLGPALGDLLARRDSLAAVAAATPGIENIRAAALTIIANAVTVVQATMTAVAGYAGPAQTALCQARDQLAGGAPVDEVMPLVKAVETGTAQLADVAVFQGNQAAALPPAAADLVAAAGREDARLVVAAHAAADELDAAAARERASQQKCEYLLSLGVFGMAALAVEKILLGTLEAATQACAGTAGTVRTELVACGLARQSLEQMADSVRPVVTSLSGIRNSVNLIGDEIIVIDENVSGQDARAVLALKVNAAIAEVEALAAAAS